VLSKTRAIRLGYHRGKTFARGKVRGAGSLEGVSRV
jgi:hypothetical protein